MVITQVYCKIMDFEAIAQRVILILTCCTIENVVTTTDNKASAKTQQI